MIKTFGQYLTQKTMYESYFSVLPDTDFTTQDAETLWNVTRKNALVHLNVLKKQRKIDLVTPSRPKGKGGGTFPAVWRKTK